MFLSENIRKSSKKQSAMLRRNIWVNDKIDWTVNDWSKVIWSDESRFALRYNDGGVRVIREFDQDKYVHCLSDNFLLWLHELTKEHDHGFIFQEDDISCHAGGYAQWKRIGKRKHQINNLEELKVIIHEEWVNLDQDICVKLCQSMPSSTRSVASGSVEFTPSDVIYRHDDIEDSRSSPSPTTTLRPPIVEREDDSPALPSPATSTSPSRDINARPVVPWMFNDSNVTELFQTFQYKVAELSTENLLQIETSIHEILALSHIFLLCLS
ncbi:hypothetical protein G6F56_001418 [Rhizopus delemar]|nr:hypothetical protein G6F56_001418 [Rhizopus delemar]